MAWNGLPAADGTAWSTLVFFGQFVRAVRERNLAVLQTYSGAPPEPAAGDNCQSSSSATGIGIPRLQQRTEQLVPRFVDVDAFPDGPADVAISVLAEEPYNGEVTFDVARWRAAAGMNAAGFTRRFPRHIDNLSDTGTFGQRAFLGSEFESKIKYEHDGAAWKVATDQGSAVDVMTDYGIAQNGDYVGPWLFNELHSGLNLLRWTVDDRLRGVEFSTGASPPIGDVYWSGVHSYAGAVAHARAGYTTPFAGGILGSDSEQAPIDSTVHGVRYTKGSNPNGSWSMQYASRSETLAVDKTTAIACAADLYTGYGWHASGAAGLSYVFDGAGMGLSAADEGMVRLVSAGSPTTAASVEFGPVGTDAIPSYDPPTGPADVTVRGVAAWSFVVLRWDVAGGFEYVD